MQKYYHSQHLLPIQDNMMVKDNAKSKSSLKINKLNHANKEENSVVRKSTMSARIIPKTREELIAETAYFKSLDREFQGSDSLKDWLEAEVEIDSQIDDGYLESYEDWDGAYGEIEDPRFCG
jgi:hypothetical protein